MVNHSNKFEEETIGTFNGQCVMKALALQKNKITEEELLEQFITLTDEPHDLVEYELKRILYTGVATGFIAKTGNRYALPSLENRYEADCDESKDDCDESAADCDESEGASLPEMKVTISKPGRYTT